MPRAQGASLPHWLHKTERTWSVITTNSRKLILHVTEQGKLLWKAELVCYLKHYTPERRCIGKCRLNGLRAESLRNAPGTVNWHHINEQLPAHGIFPASRTLLLWQQHFPDFCALFSWSLTQAPHHRGTDLASSPFWNCTVPSLCLAVPSATVQWE